MGDPFADPSIQRVAQSTTTNQRGLEDYNPFDGQQNQVRPTPFGAQQPAVVQPSTQSTTVLPSGQAAATSPAAVTQISTAELQVSEKLPSFTLDLVHLFFFFV